jgi:hypothetical protein
MRTKKRLPSTLPMWTTMRMMTMTSALSTMTTRATITPPLPTRNNNKKSRNSGIFYWR